MANANLSGRCSLMIMLNKNQQGHASPDSIKEMPLYYGAKGKCWYCISSAPFQGAKEECCVLSSPFQGEVARSAVGGWINEATNS